MRPQSTEPRPRAILDALAIIRDPALAARLPLSARALAWNIAASARGMTVTQRHRAPNPKGVAA